MPSFEMIATVLARSETDKRRVALRLELADHLPRILGDRVQLQQVRLILNGIEAMSAVEGRPRELTITTGNRDEANVLVTVRDSGTGLGPAGLSRLRRALQAWLRRSDCADAQGSRTVLIPP